MVKKLLFLILFCCLFLFLPVGFKRWTQGFKIAKMQLDLPFRKEWEISSELSMEELNQIFAQQFTYLDRGAQCYVFASADDNYVLKLFRFDRSNPSIKVTTALEKIELLFQASLLAMKYVQKETALLYLHLNLTEDVLPIVSLKGPLGQSIHLPLDQYRFALQKKVDPFRQALFMSDEKDFKEKIHSFLDLIRSRSEKGIINTDPMLGRNFGFLGNQAIEIDFGSYKNQCGSVEWELAHYKHKLRNILEEYDPKWAAYLDSL